MSGSVGKAVKKGWDNITREIKVGYDNVIAKPVDWVMDEVGGMMTGALDSGEDSGPSTSSAVTAPSLEEETDKTELSTGSGRLTSRRKALFGRYGDSNKRKSLLG